MIIVNFSSKEYLRPQKRLDNSLYGVDHFMLNNYEAIGSPTHQESPYEFKIHAMRVSAEHDPVVLWVDSSMWRVGKLSKIEEIIKRDGYFMEEAGHYVDRWCNDHTRDYFNLKEGNGYTMFSAGLLGLDFSNPVAQEFFSRWEQSAKAGCFRGDWSNHRHDMTCGSIIAQRMGLKYQTGGTHLAYVGPGYSQPKSTVVFLCQGMV